MQRERTSFNARTARMTLQPTGFFGKLFAIVGGTVLLVLGLMFSVVIIAVAVVLGLIIWGWFWWKTRALRQQMRDQMQQAAGTMHEAEPSGRVIEGEVIRRDDEPPVPPGRH
jgi:Flp pilus assembly protein TadB